MKVLFVSSGNSKGGISPIIKNQGASLKKTGAELTFFTIKGKGISGYLKNIASVKKVFKEGNFDVVHAHYSLSAFVASLAGVKPLVVSLMGSDVKAKVYYKFLIRFFNKLFWSSIIVKSADMKNVLGISQAKVIPNGVDFNRFKPVDREKCKNELGWDLSKKQVLFAAHPGRAEKNYSLALKAVSLLQNRDVELKVLKDVPNEQMPVYHNAADVVLLTSLWEGSPNVIKEAMACNIPIVSTDAGDVKEITGKTEGCYITNFESEEVAEKIKKALAFEERTTGREDIKQLESGVIAKKIIDVYTKVLNS